MSLKMSHGGKSKKKKKTTVHSDDTGMCCQDADGNNGHDK